MFIPGETVADPEYIPENKLIEETRKSILNPIGMEPISKLVVITSYSIHYTKLYELFCPKALA